MTVIHGFYRQSTATVPDVGTPTTETHATTSITYLTGHTADVDAAVLAGGRALMDQAFDDFTDADWEHSVGGVHAVALAGDQVVGHASVVQRRLLHGGRALRAGYVEGVGVHPGWQRRGIGGRLMAEVERVVRTAYDLGALGATDEGVALYTSHGWQAWRGPLASLTPSGTVPTPDADGAVYVLATPGTPLDLDAPLTCDWRDGDVW
jgi:aminoglycoside 2'-N-acetyltransferase I